MNCRVTESVPALHRCRLWIFLIWTRLFFFVSPSGLQRCTERLWSPLKVLRVQRNSFFLSVFWPAASTENPAALQFSAMIKSVHLVNNSSLFNQHKCLTVFSLFALVKVASRVYLEIRHLARFIFHPFMFGDDSTGIFAHANADFYMVAVQWSVSDYRLISEVNHLVFSFHLTWLRPSDESAPSRRNQEAFL